MSDITNIAVSAGNVVPVDTLGGQVTVKVNSGGPVYYADNAQVSSANNQGNITAGNSVTFSSPQFITGAAGVQASVTLTLVAGSSTAPGAPTDVVLGSDGLLGGPGGTGLTASVENVPAGAVAHIFQPRAYGILADAVIDANGKLVSGTDDTAAWLSLIAALPADKAVIRLHGISLISNPNALNFALGFDTSRLTIIGDGPHTGFYLADNSNCTPLQFNTDPGGVIIGPVLLHRLHLERFTVYGNGYAQTQPGGIGGGGINVWSYRHVRIKEVHFVQCRSVGPYIYDFRDARVSNCLVDTIVGGGAANGVNVTGASWAGWQSQRASITDCDFIDVPNESVFASGINVGQVIARGNRDSYRNLRPRPASIVSFTNQWRNVTQAATAYSNATDYTIGQWVSSGGFNYLCVQANGPGSSVVAPGSNQLYWWLQNRPIAWASGTTYVPGQVAIYTTATNPGTEAAYSAGTNYAIGQAVTSAGIVYVAMTASGPGNGGAVTPGTNSAVWQASTTVAPGFSLNFTALASNTNVPPVTANGTLNPNWQVGGPLFGTGANGFNMENNVGSQTFDAEIVENQGNGRNAGGEVVGEVGCYIAASAAGIATRGLIVARNQWRGYLVGAQILGDSSSAIDDNLINDCSSGILWGDNALYSQRQVSVSRNKIRLGALGKGTGILVQKAGANTLLTGLGVDDNEIDGGSALIQLTSALTNAGGPYTALPVLAIDAPLSPGQPLFIGPLMPGAGTGNAVVTVSSAGALAGATSIPVNSFTPGSTLTAQTLVFPMLAQLNATVTSGVAITSITVNPLAFPLQSGQWLSLFDQAAANFPTYVQVAPSVAGVPIGATNIPIVGVTPSKTYASGYPVGPIGNVGLNLVGGLNRFHANRNHVRYFANNLLNLTVSGGTPQAGELLDNWLDVAGNACFNIGSVGTSTPIRFEGGGFTTVIGGNTLPTSGVQVRKVSGVTPARDVATPSVPSTGTAATMPIYDGILAVTAGAGGATTIGLGTTTQGSSQDTATISVAASATVLVPVLAGQKVYATYDANTPTWQYFAQ